MESFSFIKSVSLKEKLEETFNYVKFLLSLEKKSLNKDILISLNRDIVIHTTSIIEGLLTYLLIDIVNNGSEGEKAILNKSLIRSEYKKVNSFKNLELYEGDKKLYLSILKKSKGKIDGKLNIGNLIQIIKKIKIFEEELEIGLEHIQKIRNDLHIQKVLDNDIYEKELTDTKLLELFNFTRKLQDKIVEKLQSLEKLKEIKFDLNLFITKLRENGAKGALTMSLRGSNLFIENNILKIKPRTNIAMNNINTPEAIKLINEISLEIGFNGAELY